MKITQIKQILEKHLIRKDGKIEGQRISEKWFLKNKLDQEWKILLENNIHNARDLYDYFNPNDSKCEECGDCSVYISFEAGYRKYCLSCSRTTKNHMKIKTILLENDINFKLRTELKKILPKYKDKNGNYSISKLIKGNISSKIISTTWYLNKEKKLSERIYHIINDLTETVKCEECKGELDTFFSNNKGYRSQFCKKNKCGYKNITRDNTGMFKYNYNKYHEKYSINNAGLSKDYSITMFNLEEYITKDKDVYINFIHNTCGTEYKRHLSYQGALHCPECFSQKSKLEHDVFMFITKYSDAKLNDRKLIKPLEIDILTETFGIEIDGQAYHSIGKSTDARFNNFDMEKEIKDKHLYKLNLVENEGKQLFRIFSSEWYNIDKMNIWKSIIKSKLNYTDRIYARKCIIKEVPNKDAELFLNKNHMQGSVRSKIKIGLYYNDELVSVMTFGKPRYNKSVEYELIRFSSKLNTTIVGGASKLLKYFERNYNPKSILSYANRRWSQGNVYTKLGFEFTHNTGPGYFYISGYQYDYSELESRNKYQKHKLKDKLEIYDSKLTETENMYNNGYRKIYDCGNKVYIKLYS